MRATWNLSDPPRRRLAAPSSDRGDARREGRLNSSGQPTATSRLRLGLLWMWMLVLGMIRGGVVAGESEVRFDVWTVKDGLPHNSVRWLAQTPDRFLWVATVQGLARFDGMRFKLYDPTTTPELGDANIKALSVAPTGELWVLGENGSLARRDSGGFVAVTAQEGMPPGGAHGVYSDGRRLLVVSDGEGRVYRWEVESRRFVAWLDARAIVPGRFAGINLDYDGTVWVRHDRVLHWWDGQGWRRVLAPDGSTNFVAVKTGPSRAGGMWISDPTGLRRFRQGVWEGRLLRYETPVSSLQAVFEDREGNVWVTHGGGRVWRFDLAGHRTEWHQQPAFAKGAVKHLCEDTAGGRWFGLETGLVRLRAKPGERVEGATGAGAGPGVAEDEGAPHAVLEEVLADSRRMVEEARERSDALQLPAGAHVLEFRFTGVTFDAAEEVRFRFKLEGFDRDWRETERRGAAYTNLAPGRYFFRLMAGRRRGGWEGREAAVTVAVPPRIWQTWWFRGAMATGLLAAGFLVLRQRETARKRARAQQDEFCRRLMESQEAERQRIARELHDSLGQNLLLIKNRAVMGLRDEATPEKMRAQLHEISEASAGSVEEIRAIARALRPYQLDRLGLTKTLEDVAATVATAGGLAIEVQVEPVDGLFSPEAEIGLYRIVQEGMNNALKHAAASVVRLSVRPEGDQLVIELTDDGRGIAADQREGFGLTGMRERVRLLGGTLAVQSGPKQGTRLRATIPIPKRSAQGGPTAESDRERTSDSST